MIWLTFSEERKLHHLERGLTAADPVFAARFTRAAEHRTSGPVRRAGLCVAVAFARTRLWLGLVVLAGPFGAAAAMGAGLTPYCYLAALVPIPALIVAGWRRVLFLSRSGADRVYGFIRRRTDPGRRPAPSQARTP